MKNNKFKLIEVIANLMSFDFTFDDELLVLRLSLNMVDKVIDVVIIIIKNGIKMEPNVSIQSINACTLHSPVPFDLPFVKNISAINKTGMLYDKMSANVPIVSNI
jgi:hypothetical protein